MCNNISEIIQVGYGFANSEIHIAPHITINGEIIAPDIIVYQEAGDSESPNVVIEVKNILSIKNSYSRI